MHPVDRTEMLLHDQLVRRIHPANKDRVCFHAFGIGPVVAPQGGQGTYIVHHIDKHGSYTAVRFVNSLGEL